MKSAVLTGHTISNYRERKKAAIAVVQPRIPPELQEQWQRLKKKDDVSDGAVTAWAWLEKKTKN